MFKYFHTKNSIDALIWNMHVKSRDIRDNIWIAGIVDIQWNNIILNKQTFYQTAILKFHCNITLVTFSDKIFSWA